MDQAAKNRVVKSTCGLCQSGCGVLLHMSGRQISRLEGDPDSPVNRGVLCAKGLASLEFLYHPNRLKYPLRRKGEKGNGQWEPMTWDKALDCVAEKFLKVKNDYGPESLVFMRGSFKGGFQGIHLARFANVFGAPNISSMSSVCYVPRVKGSMMTHGFNPVPDYEYPPACVVVWGANMAATRIGEHRQTIGALQKGAKLIVIDPRRIDLAGFADIWLQPRPGTDLALALGLMHVIISEGLYDQHFVRRWTNGFQRLRTHIQKYSPETVEQITWVKAGAIQQAARFYAAGKPAIIQAGNAIDHTRHNFQTARALSILRAITGNLGVPGGELHCSSTGIRSPLGSPDLDLRDNISKEVRDGRLNAHDNLLPTLFYALPQSIVKAIMKSDPYPVSAGFIQGGNLLLTYPHAKHTHDALKKLDFLVVADLVMTPTAALADIVLPAATFFEYDSIVAPPYYPVAQIQQKVAQVGQARSDYEIVAELARRLDLDEYFWKTEQACMDYILEPVGLSFEEFRNIGVLEGKRAYRQYEKDGFETPSGKVELFSDRLDEWGFDPLPTYREAPGTPFGNPRLSKEFPFVLTSWKSAVFRHSGGRQIGLLREAHPEPVVWIHPDTAGDQEIEEGDWVYIETQRGRIRQRARITANISPRVVGADYAWWFPEKSSENLYGWAEANINILTDDQPPYGREMGTPDLRGIGCKISKI